MYIFVYPITTPAKNLGSLTSYIFKIRYLEPKVQEAVDLETLI